MSARRRFTPEFKSQCVREVVERSRTVAEVVRELDIGAETLRNWVKAFRRDHPDVVPEVSESERPELVRLRT